VHEKDLVDGEKLHSRFALDSLIVEARVRIGNVEDYLLHFVQLPEIVTERDILQRLTNAGITGSAQFQAHHRISTLHFRG
jgi:hypothetical protein